jgi:hypothetical protein
MIKNAYDRGRQDYQDSMPKTASPYDAEGDAWHDLWIQGWEAAYLEGKLYGGTWGGAKRSMTRAAVVLCYLAAFGLFAAAAAFAAWLCGW